jgi:hypothetical protein
MSQQQAAVNLELQMYQAANVGAGVGRLAGAGIAFGVKKTFWGAVVGVWAGGFVGSLVGIGVAMAAAPKQPLQPAPTITDGLGAALRGSLGLGAAPPQVQEWGKRGMDLGPYHASSTHGDSPFLFGQADPSHYHRITEQGRTNKDYLTGMGMRA